MTTSERRAEVEAILQYLLARQRFCRVHFYGPPILYLWGPKPSDVGTWFNDEANIHVESRWQLFNTIPSTWPQLGEDLPDQPMEELVSLACRLRNNEIVRVQLGEEAPHLIITFDNGQVLFVNGHHERYESWEVNAGQGQLQIVAVPGDGLAMWLPEDFRQG